MKTKTYKVLAERRIETTFFCINKTKQNEGLYFWVHAKHQADKYPNKTKMSKSSD